MLRSARWCTGSVLGSTQSWLTTVIWETPWNARSCGRWTFFVPPGCLGGCLEEESDAVLLARKQPPVALQTFSLETFVMLHADVLALLQRLSGLLNQTIIAKGDVEG
jgi:hypothetical protein